MLRLLGLCHFLVGLVGAVHFPHASEYPDNVVLSPDEYELFWKLQPNSDSPETISLVIHAKTAGWFVDGGSFEDGWTTVRAHRTISANGDTQDRDFGSGLVKVLWAHGETDVVQYHGTTRGVGGIAFRGATVDGNFDDPDIEEPWLFPNQYAITSDETVYYDARFDVPLDVGCITVVGFDHQLNPTTAMYVHHFVLYGTRPETGIEEILWAWAPGVAPLVIPPEAGLPFGTCGYTKVRQNIHYNNPSGTGVGLIDTSGVKVFWTRQERAYTAGVISLGDVIVTQDVPIPQGDGLSTYNYDCPAACTNQLTEPLNVYGFMPHMHSTGSQTVTTHWRGDERLADLAHTDFWSFNFQTTLLTHAIIQPGDSLRSSCTFRQRADRPTIFKDASSDEMCVQFMYVWPRPSFSYCGYLRGTTSCAPEVSNPSMVDDDSVRVTVFGQEPSVCPWSPSDIDFGGGDGDTVVVNGRHLRH